MLALTRMALNDAEAWTTRLNIIEQVAYKSDIVDGKLILQSQ